VGSAFHLELLISVELFLDEIPVEHFHRTFGIKGFAISQTGIQWTYEFDS